MSTIKYKLINEGDTIVVITDDGGCADIRAVEELSAGDGRQTTIELYQDHFTEEDLLSDEPLYEILGEGKMYYEDFTTPYTSEEHVKYALNWLTPSATEYVLDESIWAEHQKKGN